MLGVLLHAPRGSFYSPKAARIRWRPTRKAILAFCRVVHRTVRCTTEQPLFMSGARSPSISSAADHCSSGPVGAPDSPVPPADHWSGPRVARWSHGRPLAAGAVGSPDSLVNFSRTPLSFSREQPVHHRPAWRTGQCPVHHRTMSGAPPDSPVCQARADVGCSQPILFQIRFSFLCTVSSTWTNMLVLKIQFTESRNIPRYMICTSHSFSTQELNQYVLDI
jgi:hypothetical protein